MMGIRTFFLTVARIAASAASMLAQESSDGAPAYSFDETDLVVVVGGSGRTGQLVIRQLTEMGVQVRATTRDVEAARDDIGADYDWVAAEASDTEALAAAIDGATYVVSAIGNSKDPENVDYKGVANAVDAAKAANVKRFVLISSGGVTHGPEHFLNRTFNNLLEWKFKGEEHLRSSGLDYAVVRPNGLLDALDVESKQAGIYLLQGDGRFPGLITRENVARVAIEALINPDASRKMFEAITAFVVMPDQWMTQFQYLNPDE